MTTRVVVAVSGPREAAIAAAVSQHPELTLARRCADLTEALAVAHAGLGTVVVLSEHKDLDRNALAQLTDVGLCVVGAPTTPDAADYLHGLGITHLMTEEDTSPAWHGLIMSAIDNYRPSSPAPDEPAVEAPTYGGRIIAVWGPTGAPGRTTVAVNLAAELAHAGQQVIVADVDTYGGAVHHAVGLLDEAPGVAALARASLHGTLTALTVNRHALVVSPGLRVLTGISRPDRWAELSGPSLEAVWPLLRDSADAIVVDCGFGIESDEFLSYDTHAPQRNAATLSALEHADAVVAVTAADGLGVQRFITAVTKGVDAGVMDRGRLIAVANKARTRLTGLTRKHEVADLLARHLDIDSTWLMPWDPQAAHAATMSGRTLIEAAPRSRLRQAVKALARPVYQQAVDMAPASRTS